MWFLLLMHMKFLSFDFMDRCSIQWQKQYQLRNFLKILLSFCNYFHLLKCFSIRNLTTVIAFRSIFTVHASHLHSSYLGIRHCGCSHIMWFGFIFCLFYFIFLLFVAVVQWNVKRQKGRQIVCIWRFFLGYAMYCIINLLVYVQPDPSSTLPTYKYPKCER